MADIFNTLGRNDSGGIWGSITGNILNQTDLINYLEDNYYPLNTNPSGYLTLNDLPPQTLQDIQSVLTEGNIVTDLNLDFISLNNGNTLQISNNNISMNSEFGETALLSSTEINMSSFGLYSIIQGGVVYISEEISGAYSNLGHGFLELSPSGTSYTFFYPDRIIHNATDYFYPEGISSRIATLNDITDAISGLTYTPSLQEITDNLLNIEGYAETTNGIQASKLKAENFKVDSALEYFDFAGATPNFHYTPSGGLIIQDDAQENGVVLFQSGVLQFIKNSFSTELEPTATTPRLLFLPDKDGTLATLGDIPTLISELTNDVGYITEQRVEEYPDFASFPLIGEEEVVYIAADTGLFYSWNGSTYISSSPPISGITGGGIINRLPKFTPDGTTLGSSNFSDTGFEGRYSLSATNFISFYPTGNIWLRLQRSLGNHMDLILGNAGVSQTASLTANNTHGVEVIASAATAFLALKAGGFEGLRVLPTGQLRFTQTPSAGTTSDSVLVRDSSGNIKTVEYPTTPSLSELHNVNITSPQNHDVLMYNNTVWENKNPFDYFDAKPIIYQKHVNMPVWGTPAINNVEGVSILGNNTSRTWADTNIVTRTQRQGVISITTGNAAQIRQLITYLSQIDGFNVVSGFNMAENATDTAIRFFIGLSTTTLFNNVEPNTLLNCIGFCRLSTSNNIHLVHNDNAGIGTTLDLGSNFPANTISTDKYLVYWKTVSTGIYIKIERVGTAFTYETIVTSDIPSTTTALNFGAYIVDTSGASVSTGFDWYGTHIQV